jgi:transcription elongation factor Elf1
MQVDPKLINLNFQCPACDEEAEVSLVEFIDEEMYMDCEECGEKMEFIDAEIEENAAIMAR